MAHNILSLLKNKNENHKEKKEKSLCFSPNAA